MRGARSGPPPVSRSSANRDPVASFGTCTSLRPCQAAYASVSITQLDGEVSARATAPSENVVTEKSAARPERHHARDRWHH